MNVQGSSVQIKVPSMCPEGCVPIAKKTGASQPPIRPTSTPASKFSSFAGPSDMTDWRSNYERHSNADAEKKGIGDYLGDVLGIVKNVTTKPPTVNTGTTTGPVIDVSSAPAPKKGLSPLMWGGIGLGVVLIGTGLYFAFKK